MPRKTVMLKLQEVLVLIVHVVLHLLLVVETVPAYLADYVLGLPTLDLLVSPQASPVMIDFIALFALEYIFPATLALE